MMNVRVFKSAEVKGLLSYLSSVYDTDVSFLDSYYFYLNLSTNKVYICNFDVLSLNMKRVNSFGLYFGTFCDNNRFRLSINGAQMINPKSNFIVLNDKSLKSYVAGENLFISEVDCVKWDNKASFLIVRYKNESLGSVSIREKEILCYVPKSRRLCFNKIF